MTDTPVGTETLTSGLARSAERFALPVIWLILLVVFSALRPDTFLTAANFSAMFASQTSLLVLALAVTVPLTAGDFDLSIGSTAGLTAMIVAVLNVQHNMNIWYAVAIGMGAAAIVGFVNSALTIFVGVDTLIVTLGMGTLLQGLISWLGNFSVVTGVSKSLVSAVVLTRFLGIPAEFWYGLAICVFLWYLMEFTPLGRRILIVGQSRSVARLSGLKVGALRTGALVSSALLAGLAGVLVVGTTGSADQTSATQLLLPAFAAAFLGATTILPGRFNAVGVLISVLFLVTGITGLQQLGVPSFVQNLFYGAALIAGVVLSHVAGAARQGPKRGLSRQRQSESGR